MTSLVALDPRVVGMSVSPTLAARTRSARLSAGGRRVHRLGLGQSPFPVPRPVVAALRQAAAEKDYLPPGGLAQLRGAVAEHHRRRHGLELEAENIVVGPGSKELMFLLQLCFRGDILVPTPRWVSYAPQARLAGRLVVPLRRAGRHDLMIDLEHLERVCRRDPARRRLLFFNSPSNPTGLAYTPDELGALAEVCRTYEVVVLSDEIYGELTFSRSHRSIASLYPEGTIVSSGLSKWCGAGGWRLGTLALPATLRGLRHALEAVASETYSSTSAPIQHAAIAAFREDLEIDAYLADARRILAALMTWTVHELGSAGIELPAPDGGFYVFPCFEALRGPLSRLGIVDDVGLVDALLGSTGIVGLPGSAFGMDPSALWLRLALVDFDGAQALEAASSEIVNAGFVKRHLTPVWEAVCKLAAWCRGLQHEVRA